MNGHDLALSALGVHLRRGALPVADCRALVAAAGDLDWVDADVLDADAPDGRVRPGLRRTRRADLPPPFDELVDEVLGAARPGLEADFGVELAGYERPQLLRYVEGDFFGVHADRADDHELGRQRRVSVSLFLNAPDDEPGYAGGELVFYGLFDEPGVDDIGLPLRAEAGMLAAFPSGARHAVAPVTAGERLAVVTWWAARP